MFGVIAPRYDLITRIFSYGMDRRWKRAAVGLSSLKPGARILDLACGTADFSKIVLEHDRKARVVACDLTEQMLRRAAQQGIGNGVCADAMCLPFDDGIFDAVFVGYGLRNFPDLAASIKEIRRVLHAGGVLASLDFYLPSNAAWREIYLGYLFAQGALWGTLLHGEARIYTYIPKSLRTFISARDFSRLLRESGYSEVRDRTYLAGGIAVHIARAGAVA